MRLTFGAGADRAVWKVPFTTRALTGAVWRFSRLADRELPTLNLFLAEKENLRVAGPVLLQLSSFPACSSCKD